MFLSSDSKIEQDQESKPKIDTEKERQKLEARLSKLELKTESKA